jgi:mRNA interferase MazF
MGSFMKGDIVIIPFPFSNLTGIKKRPALVVANLEGDDLILSQITSISRNDKYSVVLSDSDFKNGLLKQDSVIRANRLFTCEDSIIIYKIGNLKEYKIKEVEEIIIKIFK